MEFTEFHIIFPYSLLTIHSHCRGRAVLTWWYLFQSGDYCGLWGAAAPFILMIYNPSLLQRQSSAFEKWAAGSAYNACILDIPGRVHTQLQYIELILELTVSLYLLIYRVCLYCLYSTHAAR